MFQHTAARRRLLDRALISVAKIDVSTHSRPKAAANKRSQSRWGLNSFNTQPPEGGCLTLQRIAKRFRGFNTQPPEGGCQLSLKVRWPMLSFNTQPPEGGCHFVNLEFL